MVAEFSTEALVQNYLAIREQVPGKSLIPMVKANGYGHGEAWVAKALVRQPDLYGLGVATLDEGYRVRQAITMRNRKVPVIVFSGASVWSEEKGHFCAEAGLTPVISSEEDWKAFRQGGWDKKLSYELKFNTGMNRLGIPVNLASQIARNLQNLPAEQHPAGVSSHMAMGETPDSPISRKQLEQFRWLRSELSGALPQTHFHLANSSTIWNSKYFQLHDLTDAVRPGLSLYGIPPWEGAPARGIRPVMTLKAKVLNVLRLKQGESIGYGATFTVKEDGFYAAVLGIGYGDGLHRTLSNGGYAWLEGRAIRILGVVSMDLSVVEATSQTKVGQWVELYGDHVDPWAQAKQAKTIPYELLTSVSPRVERSYDGE